MLKLIFRIIMMLCVLFVMQEQMKEKEKTLAEYGVITMELITMFVFAFYEF